MRLFEALFLGGMVVLCLGAIIEHKRWTRVLVVIGVLLMFFALAPSIGRLLFT